MHTHTHTHTHAHAHIHTYTHTEAYTVCLPFYCPSWITWPSKWEGTETATATAGHHTTRPVRPYLVAARPEPIMPA